MSTPNYHASSLRLLPIRPSYSTRNSITLTAIEQAYNLRFPVSFRQWYELKDSLHILAEYSNGDHPIPLEDLGKPLSPWLPAHPLQENILPFMRENQGICTWAIRLDSGTDPAVVVAIDSGHPPIWQPCASHFSLWLHAHIQDHLWLQTLRFQAQAQPVTEPDLNRVFHSRFFIGYTTYGWPGRTNYRFYNPIGSILIWSNMDQADWMICGTHERAEQLLRVVWNCSDLATTLYGVDESDERILSAFREANRPE